MTATGSLRLFLSTYYSLTGAIHGRQYVARPLSQLQCRAPVKRPTLLEWLGEPPSNLTPSLLTLIKEIQGKSMYQSLRNLLFSSFALTLGIGLLSGHGNVTADEPATTEAGFKSIFNGKDLTGWKGRSDLWSVEDGSITGRTTEENKITKNTFLIWDEGKVGNFELRLKFKMLGGNSGIQYRSKVMNEDEFIVGGYQADIDDNLTYAGINYEEKGRGILALRGQRVTLKEGNAKEVESFGDAAEIGKVIKRGEWNDYKVVAVGNRLQHYINGTLTAEVIDQDEQKRSMEGVLAFQVHVGPPMVVQFKDVMLKQL